MPNFNKSNRGDEFCPIFKINYQPSVSGHVLAVIQQTEDTVAKINRLKYSFEQANHLLTNGKNLSSESRQKLKHKVEVFTQQLAQLEDRFEKITHTQNNLKK